MRYKHLIEQGYLFVRYLIKRIAHDRINVNAGYLAYITLLSIVPMLTVLLSILSQFPLFSNVGESLQTFIITNFVPAAGDAVQVALIEFVANTGKMTALGGGFLFVAALMLISNIDTNLNHIWRIRVKRRAIISFSIYWMILTLGPIFIGASFAATSYILTLEFMGNEAVSGIYQFILRWLPFKLSVLAFVVLYLTVPNTKVRFSHAVVGAVVASMLFEFSKKGFALYITQFPSYQLIYGALAAIPILFVWIYLCWFIVLIGAEITASLGERDHWYRVVHQQNENEQVPNKSLQQTEEKHHSKDVSVSQLEGKQSDRVDPKSQ